MRHLVSFRLRRLFFGVLALVVFWLVVLGVLWPGAHIIFGDYE